MSLSAPLKFFDARAVHAALDYPSLIEALRIHHLRDVDMRQSVVFEQPKPGEESAYFLSLPAWRFGEAAAAKLVTVFPANERIGGDPASVHAIVVLFDGENGRPLAVIDGTALTLRKTAADSGLGAFFLAAPEPVRMLMVGAGAMAPHLILAHRAARPSLCEFAIWNRTPARAEALAETLRAEPLLAGAVIASVTNLEAEARRAEVISCATMATEPLIRGAWLRPGAHLDLVGSFRPDMHECDVEALRRASLFVDSPWSALEDCGELLEALQSGALTPDQILATSFSLARGEHPGRTRADEITLFKNGGGGHLDLMVAQHLVAAPLSASELC